MNTTIAYKILDIKRYRDYEVVLYKDGGKILICAIYTNSLKDGTFVILMTRRGVTTVSDAVQKIVL